MKTPKSTTSDQGNGHSATIGTSASLTSPAFSARPEILCATDFSPPSIDAADVAAALATSWKCSLHLVHCTSDWLSTPDVPVIEPWDEIIRRPLEAEGRRLRSECEEVFTDLRHGVASAEIPYAVNAGTQLIVTGSTGRGAAGRWLLGSTAERIAEDTNEPTLVVRNPQPLLEWLRQGKTLRVLCAVDFTVSADAAIAAVKQLATAGGNLHLEAAYVAKPDDVHLLRPAAADVSAQSEGVINLERDVWERLHLALGDMPAEVHIRIANGNPAHEFVRLADECHADLLVVGTHQKHGLRRLMEPSFSRGVLAHSATNVLCVPLSSYKPESRIPSIQRALVATDLTENGNSALAYAYSLLPMGGAVKILHVCKAPSALVNPLIASQMTFDRGMETARHKREAEEKLSVLVPRQLATSGVSTTTEVLVHVDVAQGICEEAERCGADVICMAANVPARAVAAIFGSVINSVISRTHLPVFVVTKPKV
jgi:nucleotide-binding universal stress UspA family protein